MADAAKTETPTNSGDPLLFADEAGLTPWVEVFRAGKYPQGEISEGEVAQAATDYSPTVHDAPATIDHKAEGPAYGWVAAAKAAGKSLLVRFRQVTDDLKTAVNGGRFPKRSVEFYRPDASPTGRLYLKAVSFLGARAPQVKGMPDPAFNDRADSVIYLFEGDPMADEKKTQTPTIDAAAFAELQAKVAKFDEQAALVAKLSEANTSLAGQVVALEQKNVLAEERVFCESLSKNGKLVPALGNGLPELLVSLREIPEAATISFAEADGKPATKRPYAFLREWLGQLGKLVHFGEVYQAKENENQPPIPAGLANGAEEVVGMSENAKALAYQDAMAKAGTPVSYTKALIATAPKK